MGREGETDDFGDAGAGQLVDGLLDARFGVAESEADGEAARRLIRELVGEHRALRLGALDERAEPADRVVAPGEVGELLGARRPAAPDVGVVGSDVLMLARRSIGHEHEPGGHVAVASWT